MERKLLKYLLLVFIILSSCASRIIAIKPNGPVNQEFRFKKSYDDAWQILLTVLADFNLQIDTIDKESGVITTSKQRTTKYEMAKISYWKDDMIYQLFDYCEYKITIYVQSQDGNANLIKIVPYYEGIFINSEGVSKPTVLKSNGKLEEKISNKIVEIIKA